jgi:hypothetical protein
MNFHAEFTPKKFITQINHQQKIMLMGSCFTENIGEKLLTHKFQVLQNPNGILFNPVSVKEAFEKYIHNELITTSNLFYLNEGYHSWHHHSRFSAIEADDAVEKINTATNQAHQYLKNADWLVITYGSAWVYELTNEAANATSGSVAANNHKAPANWFNRRLLTSNEVVDIITNTVKKLHAFNANFKIIFTVSPVRHLREGFVENNRSKAALIHAVHNACEQYSNAFYFPAYELVIDDLRDYRFYAEDLVHPNYAATNYVWEKFITTCIDERSQQLMQQINEINAAVNHKPFNPQSQAHKRFITATLQKIDILKKNFNYLSFSTEEKYFATNGSAPPSEG